MATQHIKWVRTQWFGRPAWKMVVSSMSVSPANIVSYRPEKVPYRMVFLVDAEPLESVEWHATLRAAKLRALARFTQWQLTKE